MQKSNVDFYPVLLLSILADTLLRLHTGYWARAGLLALPASAAVLAAVLLLVSTSWQGNALLQKVLCVLLAISSALEILRLHALFGSVYPGTLGLAGTCFVVLAPVIYLRREPALREEHRRHRGHEEQLDDAGLRQGDVRARRGAPASALRATSEVAGP